MIILYCITEICQEQEKRQKKKNDKKTKNKELSPQGQYFQSLHAHLLRRCL